jgi:hypothetical protein
MTILPHDVLLFIFCLLLWPCILARHFVLIWDVQTLTIVYMTFVVLWMVLVFFCGYVYGYVYGCVWVCVWVMCMDTGSRSSARPGSINIGAYLSLGPVSIIIGTYSLLEARFYHHRVLLLHEAHFIIIGTYSFTRPISMTLRIFPIFLDKKWKNFPQYAMSNKFF